MISIKTEKRFTTSDGHKHDSLREAQISELKTLFRAQPGASEQEALTAATLCVQHAEKVMDVLTTRESSLPKARAVNGGTKKRGSKRHVAAQAELPAVAVVNGEATATSA